MRAIVTSTNRSHRYNLDVAVALLLSLASAAVVVWQNTRLAVLWDVSYILENATRIAGGEIPYRDFPFPYAPLTFSVQAAILKIFGRVYWHHIAYAAIACAAATALTYSIARRLAPRAAAIALTAPLALLGIYCIFPHPFYDPDCCLVILALIAALLSERRPMLVGALCITPLLVKQNIGLAFVAPLFVLLLIERRWRAAVGMIIGGAIAAVLIAVVFGIGNYAHWTVAFAAERRLPAMRLMIGIYDDIDLWWQIAVVITGGILLRFVRTRWVGALLVAAPWLWTAWRFFATDDPNEREINLLRMWPLVLAVAIVATLAWWRRERGMTRILPLLIVATVHGTFLSQQTWGSTYGIWPLLVILMAWVVGQAIVPVRIATTIAIVIAAVTLLSATDYLRKESRLTYVKWDEGTPATSRQPSLRGLRMRGPWLADFDELVTWTEHNIPREDAILSLPGEDLFYFSTGRRPRFPVLMFDRTINPYAPAQIAALAETNDVRWVIVKRALELNGTPFPELGETLHLLRARFVPAAFLRNYVVFRRQTAGPANAGPAGHTGSVGRTGETSFSPPTGRR